MTLGSPDETVFPVILLAPLERQTEATEWVARGEIEFVARESEYFGLAASLLERRLRSAQSRKALRAAASFRWPPEIGEVIRHEINNPLTGILGNAELVLAHRERFSAAEAQRLETVVDLAVRLRETVRRLSDSIESQHRSVAV